MLLIKQHIEKDLSGYVTLRPQEDEDIWHAYNLIQQGDQLRGSAVRRVTTESSTGSTSSHRVHLNLTIQVEKVLYSALASDQSTSSSTNNTTTTRSSSSSSSTTTPEDLTTTATTQTQGGSSTATLHISGKVTSENPHVKKGVFHTLDLEVGRDFTIIKPIGEWDSINRERIREVTEPGRGAEVGAIVCGQGVANICVITNHTTIIRQRIDVAVPRKRKGGGTALGADKANDRFNQQVYAAVVRHFDFDTIKVLIIASPGFTKESVYSYLIEEAVVSTRPNLVLNLFTDEQDIVGYSIKRQGNKTILQAKSKFLLLHSPSHHVHSLAQILSSPEISSQLKDTKFAQEGQLLEKFFKTLDEQPLRAWYGEEHVFKAAERGAIGKLLISDEIFRSHLPARRKRFVKLVEEVKAYGGEVLIFSSMHESGQQLNQLTGIAALLTYPLDVEEVMEQDRIDSEEAKARSRLVEDDEEDDREERDEV